MSHNPTPHEEAIRLLTLVSQGAVLEAFAPVNDDPIPATTAPDASFGPVLILGCDCRHWLPSDPSHHFEEVALHDAA